MGQIGLLLGIIKMNTKNHMKNVTKVCLISICIFLLSNSKLLAQAPLGFNYQGVALTNAGTPVASKKISLRISLLESQQLGNIIYQETHGVNTDNYGQFSVIIGNGQVVKGKMSDVQWSKFPYYLKVELDIDGGSSFAFVGTSQLLSVPYALYANNAGAASISVDSVKNELATIKLSQKGDSIILSNNRGAVYIPKVDSLSKVVNQLASIKAGNIKYIKDSISKLPNGIAIGYNALINFDSTAFNSSNIALGQNAGGALTKTTNGSSNADNILIGQNTAAGINASNTISGAYQNIMIGNGAGQTTNPLASQNIVIGHEAAKNSNGTIGTKTSVFNNNIAIGSRSLKSAIISQSNVSIGVDNLNASTQLNRNIMIGSNSVTKYNGDDNVIIGAEMLSDTSSNGSKNVIIGSIVAKNLRGSKNVIIGYRAAYDSTYLNTNNKLIIANDSTRTPLIFGEFDNKKVTINGDLLVTGKTTITTNSDSLIKILNKRIDSLVSVMSIKTYGKIDSSTLASLNPVIATKFLDSTFLPSINFDGKNTHIALGKIDLLSQKIYNRTFTVEAWVKSTKVSDTTQMILCNGYQSNGNVGTFALSLYKGRIVATVGNFSGYSISADFPKDSLWHHVVFEHENNSKYSLLFIDGIEKYRVSNLGVQGMVYGSINLDGIGANLDGGSISPREYFKGSIRKIRVSKGALYQSNFTPSFSYAKGDSTIAFWELNDLGTHIKANDSAYNGTLYNGAWLIPDTSLKLNSGLIAYYPFSGNANDSSGNSNNGVVYGAKLTSDRFGNPNSSYDFNENYITVPNSKNFEFNDYSISFWASTSSTTKQVPLIKLNYDNANYEHFGFAFNDLNPNGFEFASKFDNANCLAGVGWQKNEYIKNLADGKFHHFVGSVNKDVINLYIDGLLVKTLIAPSKISSSCFSGDLQIGRNWKNDLAYFIGKIDDIRIYNRVLNQAEITYLSTH